MSRRDAVKTAAAAAIGSVVAAGTMSAAPAVHAGRNPPRIRCGVIGINHAHIYGMTDSVLRGGGELVAFHAAEDDLATAFQRRYPDARRVRDEREILEDNSIQLVMSSIIPDQRAPLGIRVMQHGKDYMADKPGIITLQQLEQVKRVQAQSRRIYSICYSERFENRSTVAAGDLVKAGAIGQVVQTVGLGPHRVNAPSRPAWFWDPARYGGIICDIGSHQCDQFLFFTGSTQAEVVASQVRNVKYQDKPGFQDFGDCLVKGNGGTGYIRLDWFTPDGLATWGDGRLTVLGTEGFIETRKYVDIGGRAGGNHLFICDGRSTRYMDCRDVPLPYGEAIVNDVLNRTETAMTQAHCFLATELALTAQAQARLV